MTTPQGPGHEAEPFRAPLLLHSLSALGDVIFPCLELAGAVTVVEVGGEEGMFTRELAAWVEKAGGSLYCVDPEPSQGLADLCEASDAVHLVQGRSPEALEELEGADAYLLDGDHNYYTVSRELEVVERKADGHGGMPLVFLHDVGWPCGRRDQYYSPESLPPDAVHAHTYEMGVRPGCAGVVQGGFRGAGEFAVALEEGGPRNGVLTAVEDFLEGRDDLALARIPCVFGLGVMYGISTPEGRSIGDFLAPYNGQPLLERLEANRIALYLEVLSLLDGVAELSNTLRDVNTENRALWARTAELEAHLKLLSDEAGFLLASRAFTAAEWLARIRGSKAPSRDRLRAALGGEQPA